MNEDPIDELAREIKAADELYLRLKWLLGYARLWSAEGSFTFPDGETMWTHDMRGCMQNSCIVKEGRCACE